MKILAIETSCDETAAAIISKEPKGNYVKVLSNVVASSLVLHSKTGGIVPEIAAREQVRYIIPVIQRSIKDAFLTRHSGDPDLSGDSRIRFWTSSSTALSLLPKGQNDVINSIDAIAVTTGPGLIGSLLVGVETAKTLAYIWKKPIIPVNHLLGHIYANFIQTVNYEPSIINFPALALLVSGGHTDLILIKSHKDIEWLGATLDDAAGEAFDKIGRLLNFPYPAGPAIEKASIQGVPNSFIFPRPMIGSHDFNFSFSGLKAAASREVLKLGKLDEQQIADISLAVQKSIVEVLVRKTIKAAKQYNVRSILLGGGVAANQKLKEEMYSQLSTLNFQLHVPPAHLCTDNAAMIGAYATFNYKPIRWNRITANPELYFL